MPIVAFSTYFFFFNRRFLTDTHPLNPTEKSHFLSHNMHWMLTCRIKFSSFFGIFFSSFACHDQPPFIHNKFYSVSRRSFSVNLCTSFCMLLQAIMHPNFSIRNTQEICAQNTILLKEFPLGLSFLNNNQFSSKHFYGFWNLILIKR